MRAFSTLFMAVVTSVLLLGNAQASVVDFEGLEAGPAANPLSYQGLTFSTPVWLNVVDGSVPGVPGVNNGTTFLNFEGALGASISSTAGSPFSMQRLDMGLSFGGLEGSNVFVDIVGFMSGGGQVTQRALINDLVFSTIELIGFNNLTRVDLRPMAAILAVDNIHFTTAGESAPVPVPATLALLALGLLGLSFSKRKAARA